MNTRIVIPIAALLVAGGAYFVVSSDAESEPPGMAFTEGSPEEPRGLENNAPSSASAAPSAAAPAARPNAGKSITSTDEVDADLNAWRALYEPRARVTEEELVAIQAERKAHADQVIASIGGLEASDIDHVSNTLQAAPNKERLMLVRGLGANDSPQAVAALEGAYEDIGIFRVREEILRALGDSAAPGHTDLAVRIMVESEDVRLAQVAAQSLYGEESALGKLEALMYSDAPIEVRLEAIHSIGGIKNEAAAAVLRRLIANPDTEARVRMYAEQELRRMGAQ
jgi:HEAT repeat protein